MSQVKSKTHIGFSLQGQDVECVELEEKSAPHIFFLDPEQYPFGAFYHIDEEIEDFVAIGKQQPDFMTFVTKVFALGAGVVEEKRGEPHGPDDFYFLVYIYDQESTEEEQLLSKGPILVTISGEELEFVDDVDLVIESRLFRCENADEAAIIQAILFDGPGEFQSLVSFIYQMGWYARSQKK